MCDSIYDDFQPITAPTGGLGVSALTGVIVGAVLGTALLIAFYFFR